MRYYDVAVQINDHRNGMQCNRIGGVTIDGLIELEPCVIPEPRYAMGAQWISIHRKKFRFEWRQTWVGNWCWDSLHMSESTVCQLIAHLLKQRCLLGVPTWAISAATGDGMIELMERAGKGETIYAEDVAVAMKAEHNAAASAGDRGRG